MQNSKFTSTEYADNRKIEIEQCISVVAYNNSDVLVSVNKIVLRPTEMKTIVTPDFSVSNVSLDIFFMPIPIAGASNRPSNIDDYAVLDGIFPSRIPAEKKRTVVLHVKKL